MAVAVVEIESQKRQTDSESLDRGGRISEPNDRGRNNEDALYERRDGVRYGRDHGEEDEREDILRKVGHAVEDELRHKRPMI